MRFYPNCFPTVKLLCAVGPTGSISLEVLRSNLCPTITRITLQVFTNLLWCKDVKSQVQAVVRIPEEMRHL